MRVLNAPRLHPSALIIHPLRRVEQLRLQLIDGGRHLCGAPPLEAAFDETVLERRAAAPHGERHPVGVEV